MKKQFAILGVCVLLAGCVNTPQGVWHRGATRVDASPTLFEEFNRDRVVCDGRAAEAALNSRERDLLTHNRNVNLVFDACLTEKGYMRRS